MKRYKNRIAEVNAAIRAQGGREKLVRGAGYYYFQNMSNGAPSSGVYVYRASELSVERWLEELKEKRTEVQR